jgi:exodeoxyribonuclease V alpha subunit
LALHATALKDAARRQGGGLWPQPTTLEGIEKYPGSGMIRGIGPVYARALIGAFGEAVFDLIEQQPERLREVAGIGAKRAARIVAGWADQKAIREIMLFLHANGVGTSRAVRIFKTYGQQAIALITENESIQNPGGDYAATDRT